MYKLISVLTFISLSNSPVIAAPFATTGPSTVTYNTPLITPQKVPDAKCVYDETSLDVPGSRFRISEFEVWTTRSGNKDREPSVSGYLKLRDNDTLKDVGGLSIPMTNLSAGFITDRFGVPKTVTDTVLRKNIDIGGAEFHLFFKRTVNNVYSAEEPTVIAEMVLYNASDVTVALQASCSYQKPQKK